MIFYWTDICLLLVFAMALLLVLFNLKSQSALRVWRRIFQKPFALSAAIVLFFFILVGILDSIRLVTVTANTSETLSLLDKILSPLNTVYEKTYAAPFARHLYSAETVLEKSDQSGLTVARQVRLPTVYTPKWLNSNKKVGHLILVEGTQALLSSLLCTLMFYCLLMIYKKWRQGFWTFQCLTRRSLLALLTLFSCLFFIFAAWKLSRYFHLFGTGKIGQDIFYQTVKSIRTGLVIGLLTTIFMMPLAVFFGIVSGYYGGLIDDIIQYIYTTLSSIPGILLITASVLSLQTYMTNHPEKFPTLESAQDARLLALCFILGITSWTSLCRLLRAEALKLREMDFVKAAIALGSRQTFILTKHLLPNVLPIVLITLVLDFSYLVLAEALLAYVGVGVSPMTISWGNMINGARLELAKDPIVWWPVTATFVFMFTLVLASNLFADAVRDALDPNQVD